MLQQSAFLLADVIAPRWVTFSEAHFRLTMFFGVNVFEVVLVTALSMGYI
jgi:hypothetical protein